MPGTKRPEGKVIPMNHNPVSRSYETAPATKLLATACVACGRPLVDAASVEAGMGPDCRKKYGYAEGPAEGRGMANRIVAHMAASAPSRGDKIVATQIASLADLGFVKLATKLAERFVVVRVSIHHARYVVDAPWSPAGVEAFRQIAGRRFDAVRKTWEFPANEETRVALWAALRRGWSDTLGIGPKGPFYIAPVQA